MVEQRDISKVDLKILQVCIPGLTHDEIVLHVGIKATFGMLTKERLKPYIDETVNPSKDAIIHTTNMAGMEVLSCHGITF